MFFPFSPIDDSARHTRTETLNAAVNNQVSNGRVTGANLGSVYDGVYRTEQPTAVPYKFGASQQRLRASQQQQEASLLRLGASQQHQVEESQGPPAVGPAAEGAAFARLYATDAGEFDGNWEQGETRLYAATRVIPTLVIPPPDVYTRPIGDEVRRITMAQARAETISQGKYATDERALVDHPPTERYNDQKLARTVFPFIEQQNKQQGTTIIETGQGVAWLQNEHDTMQAIIQSSYYVYTPAEESSAPIVEDEGGEEEGSTKKTRKGKVPVAAPADRENEVRMAGLAVRYYSQSTGTESVDADRQLRLENLARAKTELMAAEAVLRNEYARDSGRQMNDQSPLARAIRIFRTESGKFFRWILFAANARPENMWAFCLLYYKACLWGARASETGAFCLGPKLASAAVLQLTVGASGGLAASGLANKMYAHTRGRYLAGICTRRFKHETQQLHLSLTERTSVKTLCSRAQNAAAYAAFLACDPHGLCRREIPDADPNPWRAPYPPILAFEEVTFNERDRAQTKVNYPLESTSSTEQYLLGNEALSASAFGVPPKRTVFQPILASEQVGFAFKQNVRPLDDGDLPTHFTLWHVALHLVASLPFICAAGRTIAHGTTQPTGRHWEFVHAGGYIDALKRHTRLLEIMDTSRKVWQLQAKLATAGGTSAEGKVITADLRAATIQLEALVPGSATDPAKIPTETALNTDIRKAALELREAHGVCVPAMHSAWNAFAASQWEMRVCMISTGKTELTDRFSDVLAKISAQKTADDIDLLEWLANKKYPTEHIHAAGSQAPGGRTRKKKAAAADAEVEVEAVGSGIASGSGGSEVVEQENQGRGAKGRGRGKGKGRGSGRDRKPTDPFKILEICRLSAVKTVQYLVSRVFDLLRDPRSGNQYLADQKAKHASLATDSTNVFVGPWTDTEGDFRTRNAILQPPTGPDFTEAALITREFILDLLSIHAAACDVWRWIPSPLDPSDDRAKTTYESTVKLGLGREGAVTVPSYVKTGGYCETLDDAYFRAAGASNAILLHDSIRKQRKPPTSTPLPVEHYDGLQTMVDNGDLPYVYLLAGVCASLERTARAIVTEVWLEMDRRTITPTFIGTKYADASHNWLPRLRSRRGKDELQHLPEDPRSCFDLWGYDEPRNGWSFDVAATFALGLAMSHAAPNSMYHDSEMFYPATMPAATKRALCQKLTRVAEAMLAYNVAQYDAIPAADETGEKQALRVTETMRDDQLTIGLGKVDAASFRAPAVTNVLHAGSRHRMALATGILVGVVRNFVIRKDPSTVADANAEWAFQSWLPTVSDARAHLEVFVDGCKRYGLDPKRDPLFGNGFLRVRDMDFEGRGLAVADHTRGLIADYLTAEEWIAGATSSSSDTRAAAAVAVVRGSSGDDEADDRPRAVGITWRARSAQ